MPAIFKFEYLQARTISRPLYFDGSRNDRVEIKTHFLFVKLKDLPLDLPTGPNPRQANLNAKPCKLMRSTLETEPEFFTDCNRGLFMVAEKIQYIKSDSNQLIVDFGVDEDNNIKGGLVDGGHTYAVLKEKIKEGGLEDLPIFITIIEGADDVLATKMARARNTSVQVKETSIANLDLEFELLKKALGEKYSQKVIWSENEDLINEKASFPVEELMALLTAMNLDLYDADHHPTVSYTGISTCFNKWLNKKTRITYESLYQCSASILDVYEYLYLNFERYAKEFGIRRFAGINGIERERGKENKKVSILLPFSEKVASYQLSKGFIMPVFSALRFLLEKKGGFYDWGIEPIQFLDKYGSKLIGKVLEAHSSEYGSNPNKTGKSKVLWENVAQTVINLALQEKMLKMT